MWLSTQWQMVKMFIQQSICPVVDVRNIHAAVCLPNGIICNSWCDLTLHLEVHVGCNISLVATTSLDLPGGDHQLDGCNTFFHPMNFGDLS